MPSEIHIRHEEGAAGIGTLAADWDRLGSTLECPHPSAPFAVVQAILAHERGTGGTAHAWIAYRGTEPAAALLGVRVPLRWAAADQLRTPGDHDAYPVPLIAGTGDVDAAAALLRSALQSSLGCSRFCFVRQSDRALFDTLRNSAPDLLFSVHPVGHASFLPVPATEQAFWESISTNFRKNLRKQQKRLDSTGGVEWKFLRAGECTSTEIERFLALEASGWKGEAGGAILMRPAAAAYYRDMLSGLARDGRLEMHQLLVGDRCVAVQVGVRFRDVLCLLKIAYDESAAHLAPGNMLFLELVRREIAAGACREIDCLTDMRWHRNWAMHQHELFDVHVYPRKIRAIALGYAPRALRAWARSSPYLMRVRDLLRRTLKHSATTSQRPS